MGFVRPGLGEFICCVVAEDSQLCTNIMKGEGVMSVW